MLISLDWISDFVDLADVEPTTIADRLTLSTAEVEGMETLRRSVAGVLVGEVVSIERLASSQGPLALATVDCGGRTFKTVCSAPNVRVGLKAPFAPAGVRLADGTPIGVSQVAGHESQGVLCSAKELGMSRWHEILLECPGTIANGTPLADHLPHSDVLIEIDNKSLTHRPDLWGHYAFARELSAIFRRPLKPLPLADLAVFDALPAYRLQVDDYENCPCYGCLEFKVLAGLPSPLTMQRRLHALDQRTYNLLVDVTNYVMLELAQPTHAFDGDRVSAIRVAPMGRAGTFTTLDGQERRMEADDLLIWNEREPVALAGIMGGLNSEVSPQTTRILLESANFKGSRVRRTSVRLGLRTESAQRFEKSQPPVNTKTAIARILELVKLAGGQPEPTSRFTLAGDLHDAYRPLELAAGTLERMAGTRLEPGEVTSILHRLGFEADYKPDGRLVVGIPPYRSAKDISIPPDIAEEVLRVYGYGQIEPKMPAAPLKPLAVNRALQIEHKAQRVLSASHGFAEVQTYGWTDDPWLARLGFEPGGLALVLRNPAAQPCRRLRTTLLPNLLMLVEPNRVHRDRFRLYELGHVFRQKSQGVDERTMLAGLSFDRTNQISLEEHYRSVKGAIEDLVSVTAGAAAVFEPATASGLPWQSPEHSVAIKTGDRPIGTLGVLAGNVLETVAPEGGQVVWFELEVDRIDGPIYPSVKYAPSPRYPGSWQDFSLVWDVAEGYAALEERLSAFRHGVLKSRQFLYVYKGKGLPEGKASYTYRFWLGSEEHTLSGSEIEEFRAALLKFLEGANIPLRA